MSNAAFVKVIREPKHGFDVICYGTKEQTDLLIRIAATLAVQGIMCRAVIKVPETEEGAISLCEALPSESAQHTVLIAQELPLPYSNLPLEYPGKISGQLKTDASQIARYVASIT